MPKLLPFSTPPSSPQESSLRLPANKRIDLSQRLHAIKTQSPEANTSRITEPSSTPDNSNAGEAAASSTIRRRSLASLRLALPLLRRESGSSKISHPAPPYDWMPEPIEEDHDGRVPVEGEKLRQLREADDEGKRVLWWRRKRALLLVVVLVVVGALAIGLGVGLSHRGSGGSNNANKGAGNRTEAPLEFPVGQWTVAATLVQANTGCTSNPDIWRCYPYTLGGQTMFDLTIANTSALYAPNSTAAEDTGPAGLPASLMISSSNPFAIPFTNQSLTYISSRANATASRLEWSFEMDKSVMPSSSIMADGGAAECTFPQTLLTGMLYLNAPRTSSVGMDTENAWPYAVEIRQSTQGDDREAVCWGIRSGSVSVPGAVGTCDCVYRNH